MSRKIRILKQGSKTKQLELTYNTHNVVLTIRQTNSTHRASWQQFVLFPDDVRELLEMIVWADSSREIAEANYNLRAKGQTY